MEDFLVRKQDGTDGPEGRDRRPGPLAGRVTFVTGEAQRLGACVRRDLSEAGAIVVAGDVREAKAQELARGLRAKGFSVEGRALDVSDPASAATAFEDTIARHGDVLVNNAGADLTGSVEGMPIEGWQRIIGVNPAGPFLAAKAVLPHRRRQGGEHIVNIVSTDAKSAWPNASAHHASKWGLLGLSHALHVEARPLHIKVTAVISGGLRPPVLRDRFPDIDQSTLQDPANVARTVRFVLSQPTETLIPEIMVLPMRETSWP